MFNVTLHSPATAGRLLGVSAERVRQLISEGRLKCLRDAAGRRIIRDRDLQRLIVKRGVQARARAARKAGSGA